jgi:hypothetical protein
MGEFEKDNSVSITLPNGYVTPGIIYISTKHPGSYNLYSRENREEDLVYKSRINGKISFIGFLDVGDNTVSINNITQNSHAGNGGFVLSPGGDGANNLNVFDNGGVIIKIESLDNKGIESEYLMQLKVKDNLLSPAISLKYLKKGDRISIPTIRKYDIPDQGYGFFSVDKVRRYYRILNNVDYIYLNEIAPPVFSDEGYIGHGNKF